MAPVSSSFIWIAFLTVLGAYVASGAVVIIGRVRRDRWQRVLRRLDQALRDAQYSEAITADAIGAPVLARTSTRLLFRIASEPTAPRDVQAVVARALVRRVGAASLRSGAQDRDSRWRRIAALRALTLSMDDEAPTCLARAMIDGRLDVKAAAVALLGQLPHPAAAGILLDALRDDRFAASRIAAALDAMPIDAPTLVASLLDAHDARLRYWGALLVRRYPSLPGLSTTLGAFTDDPDPSVRKAAIETIGRLGFADSVDRLRARLQDPVSYVRAHAARALGSLHEVAAARDVAALLADRNWVVRSAARQGLEAMGADVEAVLRRTLSHEDRFARNSAAEVLHNLGLLASMLRAYSRAHGRVAEEMTRLLARAAGPRLWQVAVSALDAATRERLVELVSPPVFGELVPESG